MPLPLPLTIVNVGYRSTNYWVIGRGRSRLLLDLGYPGTFGMMRARLARVDVPLEELRYGLATHYHIDHAGLAQELKAAGVPLLLLDVQVEAVPRMKVWTKPADCYVEITLHDNVVISCAESRAFLAEIGIAGEILPTPAHSPDSISLLLDGGQAFTGDLTPLAGAVEENREIVAACWRLLYEHGARQVYPGHGPVRPIAGELEF